MLTPVDPAALDFRYSTECANCGNECGWTGAVNREDPSFVYLEQACGRCGNRAMVYRPEWQLPFRARIAPQHQPGAR